MTLQDRLEELYNSAWVEGSNWKENNPDDSPIPSEREVRKTNKALASIKKDLLIKVIGEDVVTEDNVVKYAKLKPEAGLIHIYQDALRRAQRERLERYIGR